MGRILPFILVVQFVLLIALSTTSAWMPSRPPAELAARLELRVCPDTATTTPEMLLSGGELAGPAIAASALQLADFAAMRSWRTLSEDGSEPLLLRRGPHRGVDPAERRTPWAPRTRRAWPRSAPIPSAWWLRTRPACAWPRSWLSGSTPRPHPRTAMANVLNVTESSVTLVTLRTWRWDTLPGGIVPSCRF